jgi:Na+/H+ antiporter NhaD/arsenite permease-like protein
MGTPWVMASSANLTVAGMAERTGIRFSFIEYMKVGYPAYLYLRYL